MPASILERTATALRAAAMAYPEAHEDFPWGELAVKVKKKVFLFMHSTPETLSLSCKLSHSSDMALMLPFARPTGYGLGKSGWVSASFTAKEEPPIDLLRDWIDESYRAVAPKTLVAELAAVGMATPLGRVSGGAVKKVKAGATAKTVAKAGASAKTTKAGGSVKAKKTAKVGASAKTKAGATAGGSVKAKKVAKASSSTKAGATAGGSVKAKKVAKASATAKAGGSVRAKKTAKAGR